MRSTSSERKGTPRPHGPNRIERGVVAADARVELERNLHRFEAGAESGRQRLQVEAVAGTGERGAEASIGALEHILDARESFSREQRAIEPALARPARMHPLDHRAKLRRHQTGRLRSRDAEGMNGLVRRESQRTRRAGRRSEGTDRRTRVPPLRDVLRSHAHADPRPDLVAGNGRGENIAAGQSRPDLRDGQKGRKRHRTHVQHADPMHIVKLESLDERAVDERRMGRREPLRRAPHAACRRRIHLCQGAHEDLAPFQVGAVQRAPERVQDQQLDALDHVRRDLFEAQRRDEGRDVSRVSAVAGGVAG